MTSATNNVLTSRPSWNRPVRLTPLYHEHLAHGADMIESMGWLIPRSYGHAHQELSAVRDAVGLLDQSDCGKFSVASNEVGEVLGAVFPAVGEVKVGRTASGSSTIRAYRLTRDEALVIAPADQVQHALDSLKAAVATRRHTHVIDLTSARCCVRLLGPQAPAVLQRISALDLAPDRFADGDVIQGALARVHALVARRDTAGLVGYDLFVDRDLGAYLWQTLCHLGAPLGLQPVGRSAVEGLS